MFDTSFLLYGRFHISWSRSNSKVLVCILKIRTSPATFSCATYSPMSLYCNLTRSSSEVKTSLYSVSISSRMLLISFKTSRVLSNTFCFDGAFVLRSPAISFFMLFFSIKFNFSARMQFMKHKNSVLLNMTDDLG